MKYYDYKCTCGNSAQVAFPDFSNAKPKKRIKCRQCGKMAKRVYNAQISFKGLPTKGGKK